MTVITMIWGHSSVGRAPAWHAGGQRFESAWLHLFLLVISKGFEGVFVKALATLDQLTKKKLIIKQLISTKERGNTAVFYPREWGEDAFHQWSPEKIDFYLEEGTK